MLVCKFKVFWQSFRFAGPRHWADTSTSAKFVSRLAWLPIPVVTGTAPPGSDLCDDHYLVDAIDLRTAFRKAAISHLKRLRKRGELNLDVDPDFGDLRIDEGWEALIEHLESVEWVSFIQPPPAGSSGPSDLVRYLIPTIRPLRSVSRNFCCGSSIKRSSQRTASARMGYR